MGRKINVKNRSAGNVVYSVPDLKVRRDFLPGEIKKIDEDELTQLSYSQGGRLLITQYLQILDEPARKEINGPVEPEYNFSDEDVKNLILTGSLDSFLDALDFAPIGVIDLIKKYAVTLPMADVRKMNAMKDKLGFDVMSAIKNTEPDEDEKVAAPAPRSQRRVPVNNGEAPKKPAGRRTTSSKKGASKEE